MLNAQITLIGSSTYIGVDIGGTNTRIGLFGSLDAPDFVPMEKFPTFQSYEEQLHHVVAAVRANKPQTVSCASRTGLFNLSTRSSANGLST